MTTTITANLVGWIFQMTYRYKIYDRPFVIFIQVFAPLCSPAYIHSNSTGYHVSRDVAVPAHGRAAKPEAISTKPEGARLDRRLTAVYNP
jgi:hypothetical protein